MWTEQWSIKVDGNELNSHPTGGPYITYCPEATFAFEMDAIVVPVDGDYPVIVRLQPREGRLNFYIQAMPSDWATWETRRAQLYGWLAQGTHTFAFQVRGMPTAKSVVAVVTSLLDEPKGRRIVASALAAKPVLV